MMDFTLIMVGPTMISGGTKMYIFLQPFKEYFHSKSDCEDLVLQNIKVGKRRGGAYESEQ